MVVMGLMVLMFIKKYHQWAVLNVRPTGGIFIRWRNRPPYHKKLSVEGLSLESNALAIWRDEHNTSLLTSDMSDDIHKA